MEHFSLKDARDVAERLTANIKKVMVGQEKILSLPMFPELSTDQINYIVDCISEF